MFKVWADLLEIIENAYFSWTFNLLLPKDIMMPCAANQIILLPLSVDIC